MTRAKDMDPQEPFDGLALAVVKPQHNTQRMFVWVNFSNPPHRNASLPFDDEAAAWAWRRTVGDDRLLTQEFDADTWCWYAAACRGHVSAVTLRPYVCLSDILRAVESYGMKGPEFLAHHRISHVCPGVLYRYFRREKTAPIIGGVQWVPMPEERTDRWFIVRALVNAGHRIRIRKMIDYRNTTRDPGYVPPVNETTGGK